MKARDLMLLAILANAGSAFASTPPLSPVSYGPAAVQQPSGGAPSEQGGEKKGEKKGKKGGKKDGKKEGKKDKGDKKD